MTGEYAFFGYVPMWIAASLFLGIRLSIWGIAAALAHVIFARRYNQIRRWMIRENVWNARNWLSMPQRVWPEIPPSSEGWFVLTGLALAFAPLFSFTLPILHEQFALLSQGQWPMFAVIGLHCLLAAEVHYLMKLAFLPTFKMKWIIGWYVFAHTVGFSQVVLM